MESSFVSYTRAYLADTQVGYMLLGMLYVPVVFGLKQRSFVIPKSVEFGIRQLWAFWNIALALFSMMGVYHTLGPSVWLLRNTDICRRTEAYGVFLDGAFGRWTFYFAISKVVELGDTLFLALLDKPIPFLHWFHHWLTMMYSYFILEHHLPYHLPSIVVNYAIHSLMYLYYGLNALGMRWVRMFALPITTLQTFQMVGIFTHYAYWSWVDSACRANILMWPSLTMYGMYLGLFAHYFWMRYVSRIQVIKKDT